MKSVAPSRIVSRLLLALTLSGVFHAWLPTDRPKRKMRMADAASELGKSVAEAQTQVQVRAQIPLTPRTL
ncbi:hypothetical protein [Luteolibacter luteus]|uniref:Uncharacterized protein n=1 Tax=Luteolibacter luteus TaxID=2728835 RepID=A0A858RN14_9BACT|nr:hypothetical protein [Luteolibacter luteus]QJE97749.1 hypothetical protein HHL09_18835 [Luteolibacter luteus]